MTYPRILIVHEDPRRRAVLAGIFAEASRRVAQAGSASEALALLRDSIFDVAFLDLEVSAPAEHAAIEQIRADFPGLRLTIATGFVERAIATVTRLARSAGPLERSHAAAELFRESRA